MERSNSSINYAFFEEYLFASRQRNLVYNNDFRYFSNQKSNGNIIEYGNPDGWVYKDSGINGSIGFDNTSKECVIKKSEAGNLMKFSQALHEFPRWQQLLQGNVVSARIFLRTGIVGEVRVSLSDGVDSTSKSVSLKGSHTVDLQLAVHTEANCLVLCLETEVPYMTVAISSCHVNVGLIALENLPCIIQGVIGERKQYIATEVPPEEELSLCAAAIELDENYTRLNSVINNRFGLGENGYSMLLDMRGYFSRAWNNGADKDPDAADRSKPGTGAITGDHVSTVENDIFLKHDHGLPFGVNKQILTGDKVAATIIDVSNTSKTAVEAQGKETRPKNIAELYTIKWA